uniref:Putative host-nuclease inhibitor protein n=1 Tax=viral metagenome TaxID=1070528 RepID=A0A6H1ZFQ6_9ZZZZ
MEQLDNYDPEFEESRPIITSTHAEAELLIIRDIQKRIQYQEQCMVFAQMEIDRLKRQVEYSEERLKSYAQQVGLKTIKLNGGTLRTRERDKFIFPENEQAEAFLEKYPQFMREKVIVSIDKDAVKTHFKTTGELLEMCEYEHITDFTVQVNIPKQVDNF